jgi:type I restriction enzyme, R subunit
MSTFAKESEFEAAVIHELRQRGWGDADVIQSPSEADLLANWKQILFENNRGKDRLNEVPLTDSEMQQITALRTPLRLNGFINGKTVAITRDNPADTLHFGKEVSLKIYDRHEIAAGQAKLIALMNTHVTEANLNEYGRFDDLRETIDQQKAKAYFEGLEGTTLPMYRVNIKASNLLRDFLLRGGIELRKAN